MRLCALERIGVVLLPVLVEHGAEAQIAAALMDKASELLADPPEINHAEVLGAKPSS